MKKNNRSEETKDWIYIINYYLPELHYKCTSKFGTKVQVSPGGYTVTAIQHVTYTLPKNKLSTVSGEVSTFIHFKDPKYPNIKAPYFASGFGLDNTFQSCLYKFLLSVKIYTPIQEVLSTSELTKRQKDKIVNQITKSCTW